ncbi:MAG: hypothetical protein PHQ19_08340 [Candidatus Krumholzibacteria bacterium]|nr:hypothetical protein [Candidatus Krumholzibacteria bacterium]
MKRHAGRASRAIHFLMEISAIAILASGCTTDTVDTAREPLPVSGALVASSPECKTDVVGLGPELPSDQDCLTWEYDGEGTLRIVHANAGLNCCPGTIRADVEIDGSEIVITPDEGEDGSPCRCLCLYDLVYELSGISAEEYTITVVEQYLPEGAAILAVTVDLSLIPEGSYCVERGTYPWGSEYRGTDPAGAVSARAVCKELGEYAGMIPPQDDPALTCVFGRYIHDEAGGTLVLDHTNAAFNCCVDAIDADFTFGTGIIEIAEREVPEGGYCDCICLYDVHYNLYNIETGEYAIRIVEPYLGGRDPIEFTVELTAETDYFVRCFPRDFYPWNAGAGEDEDRLILQRLFDAIVAYIGTPYCGDCEQCRAVGYGAKPCGGPWGYLIYSSATLDEAVLEGLVAAHRSFEAYMNEKYGYASTCDVPPVPTPECFDGVCRAAR